MKVRDGEMQKGLTDKDEHFCGFANCFYVEAV